MKELINQVKQFHSEVRAELAITTPVQRSESQEWGGYLLWQYKAKRMGNIVVRIGNFYGKKHPQVGLVIKGTDYDGTNPTSLSEAIEIIETSKGQSLQQASGAVSVRKLSQ